LPFGKRGQDQRHQDGTGCRIAQQELHELPVELQARPDLRINAQPEGELQTVRYARERMHEMCRQYGDTTGIDISIESGAIEGMDVAVVLLRMADGKERVVLSQGVAFPEGTLEEARRRGFKSTTAGDVIHELFANVPANSWQAYFPPNISRETQIADAVEKGLRLLFAR
jgi:hypothetical protein